MALSPSPNHPDTRLLAYHERVSEGLSSPEGMGRPSPTGARARISCRALAALAIFLLAAHAPLILNDGVFLDDWLVLKLRQGYVANLDFLWHGAGHPVFFGYYSIANITGAPVLAMVIMTVFAIVAGAVCLALSAVRSGLLSRAEAIGVALLVWTYPGYQMWAGKANAVYVFSFGLFCIGTWLLMLAFDARGARHAAFRIAAVLAFFLSFALNSLTAANRDRSGGWFCRHGVARPDIRNSSCCHSSIGVRSISGSSVSALMRAIMESICRICPPCAAAGMRSFKWAA
jgi:hypothetical protein